MSLQEFDALIDKMRLAYEYAENLGQYTEAAKILFQINDKLPGDLQIAFEEFDPDTARTFVLQHYAKIRPAITNQRQRLAIL